MSLVIRTTNASAASTRLLALDAEISFLRSSTFQRATVSLMLAESFLVVFTLRVEILYSSFQHLDFCLVNNFIKFGLQHFHVFAFGLDTCDPKASWNGVLTRLRNGFQRSLTIDLAWVGLLS